MHAPFYLIAIGLGLPELSILLVVVLLLFGSRLPGVMRSMGQGITEFRKGLKDGEDEAEQIQGPNKPAEHR